MAHRTFFSFDYRRDLARVAKVRSTPLLDPSSAAGWGVAGLWEAAVMEGRDAVRQLIDMALDRTVATVVCIGANSAARTHVDYEIERSIERGNVVIGIRIHHIPDERLDVTGPGEIPWRLKELGIPILTYSTADDLGREIAMRRMSNGS